jgi:Na+/H+-dicarboxylate symporters
VDNGFAGLCLNFVCWFFSYFTCNNVFPHFLSQGQMMEIAQTAKESVSPFFSIEMPPIMPVMSALILSFILGLGLATVKSDSFKNVMIEFGQIVAWLIEKAIIPLFPIYIFAIFLKIGVESEIGVVLKIFAKVIIVIFAMHVLLMFLQFLVAGLVTKKNPIKSLINMLPAYVTALGTQSSAATIPVTLAQTKKNGVDEDIAGFVIPLCATIHLSGSILKIVACACAIMLMQGFAVDFGTFAGFVFMLGVVMIAAPGVPGGAIMAALGVLTSMLGFDESMIGLMIALYIAMDSFGTACNVTGDGAIAMIVNRIAKK